MNTVFTVPELVGLLSEQTGMSRKACEQFVKEYFREIADAVVRGETVKLKSLGIFKLTAAEGSNRKRISYAAAKDLAERVNEPFEAFESVVLADDVTEEDLMRAGKDEYTPRDAEADDDVQVVDEDTAYDDDQPETEESAPEAPHEETAPAETETETSEEEPSQLSAIWQKLQENTMAKGILIGLVGALVLCVVCFGIYYGNSSHRNIAKTGTEDTAAVAQTPLPTTPPQTGEINMPATMPSDKGAQAEPKVEYDYVTKTRHLTTMAKQHYGSYHMWPYIYKENEAILGHPDRITPGTRVVIPSLTKYGIDPTNAADIEKAKALGASIYAKYK